MSNVDHYALEARISERIVAMNEDQLRRLLQRLIDDGSVNTVHEMAAALNIKPRS